MSSSRDINERLASLEQILAQTPSGSTAGMVTDADAAQVHLASFPAERIRRLTAELSSDPREPDDADAVIMRLLLNEYSAAVAHLRAVAQLAAVRVDRAARPTREARKAVHRYLKNLDAAAPHWLGKNHDPS